MATFDQAKEDFLNKYGSIIGESGRRGAQARSSLTGTSVLGQIGEENLLDDPNIQAMFAYLDNPTLEGWSKDIAAKKGFEYLRENFGDEITPFYDTEMIYIEGFGEIETLTRLDLPGIETLLGEASTPIMGQEDLTFGESDPGRSQSVSALDDVLRAGEIDLETAQAIVDESNPETPNMKAQIDLFNDPTKKKKNPLDPLQGSTSSSTTGPKRI